MVMLVTLDEAKAHLRVDIDEEDDDIELKIHAASQVVLDFIKSNADTIVDSTGELILDSSGNSSIPYRVKAATLLLLGSLYKHRGEDGGKESGFNMGFLPPAVIAMLYPLRTPTVA